MGKKGQVAIFVIIALLIVAGAVAVYFLRGTSIIPGTGGALNPDSFLRTCIEPEAQKAVLLLSSQGGFANPEGFVVYGDKKIKYLCYTSQYYKTCVIQEPFIKMRFEKELKEILEPKAIQCINNLKAEYESRNYDVTLGEKKLNLSISLKEIKVEIIAPMTIKKGDETRKFEKFDAGMESRMYEVLGIAQTIVEFEATLGAADADLFTSYYPDERIKKIKLGEGTTIYKITNVVSDESFTFASRSIVWPPGYGF